MKLVHQIRRSATRLIVHGALRAAGRVGCVHTRSFGVALGRLAYALPFLRDRLMTNLRAAGMDASDDTVRTYFRRFGFWVGHSLGVYGVGLERSLAGRLLEMDPATRHHLDEAVARGKGVVLAGPHAFCHEIGAGVIRRRYPVTALVRESKDPELGRIKTRWYETALGLEVVQRPRRGSAAGDLIAMLRVLRAGKVLAITPDVITSRTSGLPVQVFGRQVMLSPGMILLSMRSGAPLITINTQWTHDPARPSQERLLGVFSAPLELPRGGDREAALQVGLQRWCDQFEARLRLSPSDWLFWLDKSWTEVLRQPALPRV